jgi:preprotein translocase subunit SecD
MKSISLLLALMSLFPVAANAAPMASFEVRLVVECMRGMAAFGLESQDATAPAERLCVSPDVIMNQEDVVKIAKVNKGRYAVPRLAITYNKAAQARISQVTREFVGHRMAIMTKGKMLSAPVILGTVSGNIIEVSGPPEGMNQLLRDLTNGSRPL